MKPCYTYTPVSVGYNCRLGVSAPCSILLASLPLYLVMFLMLAPSPGYTLLQRLDFREYALIPSPVANGLRSIFWFSTGRHLDRSPPYFSSGIKAYLVLAFWFHGLAFCSWAESTSLHLLHKELGSIDIPTGGTNFMSCYFLEFLSGRMELALDMALLTGCDCMVGSFWAKDSLWMQQEFCHVA